MTSFPLSGVEVEVVGATTTTTVAMTTVLTTTVAVG
jgi:hypothetical protein